MKKCFFLLQFFKENKNIWEIRSNLKKIVRKQQILEIRMSDSFPDIQHDSYQIYFSLPYEK